MTTKTRAADGSAHTVAPTPEWAATTALTLTADDWRRAEREAKTECEASTGGPPWRWSAAQAGALLAYRDRSGIPSSTGILELHRHYDATANERAARSIWPTSKPAVPISADEVLVRCATVRSNRRLRLPFSLPHYIDAFEHDRRTRGIAEGRVRMAARMERFVAWLESLGACDDGLDFARGHMSPEAAVWAAALTHPRHVCWLWMETKAVSSMRCPGCTGGDAAAFLASPEWAALPWQRHAP